MAAPEQKQTPQCHLGKFLAHNARSGRPTGPTLKVWRDTMKRVEKMHAHWPFLRQDWGPVHLHSSDSFTCPLKLALKTFLKKRRSAS